MQTSLRRDAVLGFIAAAIAVGTVHEAIVYLLTLAGVIKGAPWSWSSVPPLGVPRIVNNVFWGGLWGGLYGAVHDRLPGGAVWLKGLIFGLLIVVVSNWTLLPLIKGRLFGQPNQALFGGFDPQRMLAVVLILGGFGIATALIYRLMSERT